MQQAYNRPGVFEPGLALFAGVGAGHLAGMFDKPAEQGGSAKAGAGAGAVGGPGALVGHMVGGMTTALVFGPGASRPQNGMS